jgi:hypothetical protein
MRTASFRALAFACLAALALGTSANAATILQFAQTSPNDVVTATVSGSTTTLTTPAGSIPVLITNIGGTVLGTPLPAFETFIGVTSTGAATDGATVSQTFSGTIAITAGPGNTGGNFLTTTFSGAVLSGPNGGNSASLVGSNPPQNVTFTSNFAAIIPLIAGNPPENFAISFSNVTPSLTISGSTIAGFTAQNTGTFATGIIPEPASLVMASTAVFAGLGCYGWRRRKSS